MSLRATSPDGVTYRLRDAEFEVDPTSYSYYPSADAGPRPTSQLVSSETDPDSPSILLSLERGYYYVNLSPGWHVERVAEDGSATPVEAQLLSSSYTYISIQPHNTTWVSYSFGIGSRKIWFNGEAKIEINIYDEPRQYYGDADGSPTATAQPSLQVPDAGL
jgi:hypothetical protein